MNPAPVPDHRPPALPLLLRAAALGAACGARSTAGPAALASAPLPERGDGIATALTGWPGRTATGLLAAAEAVVDKLPGAPSRSGPAGLAPRLALGAGSAAVVARRGGYPPAVPALVGLTAAAVTAVLGVRLRAAAARRLGSDLPGAVAEDVLAAVLGRTAARTR